MSLTKDLTVVVRECAEANGHRPLSDTELELRTFIRTHRAEIVQNAEAAKRLKALEQAMRELQDDWEGYGEPSPAYALKRADEIMREEGE